MHKLPKMMYSKVREAVITQTVILGQQKENRTFFFISS
jgi:hypothetical protein